MASQFDHKIWGVADFKRYHEGLMPNAERHALEKASLEDPFLQDALDGYVLVKHPEEDLSEIKEKLWPAERNKTVPMPWYRKNNFSVMWKAAAVIIVIAAFTWVYISSSDNSKQEADVYASLEKKTAVQEKTADTAAGADTPIAQTGKDNLTARINETDNEKMRSLSPASSPAIETTPAVEDESFNRIEYNRSDTSNSSSPGQSINQALDGRVAGAEIKSSQAAKEKPLELKNRSNLITGTVVNQEGKPVPFASVVIANAGGVQADVNGNFSIKNTNVQADKVQIQASATNYETTNVALSNNSSNNNIVLAEQQNTLNEVVVTGAFSTKRTARSASSSVSKKNVGTKWTEANSRVLLKGAEPLGGWDQFYTFMNDSTNLPNNSFTKKGAVTLRFKVDSTGKPIEIKVIRSLSAAADTLSKKLLGQAPPIRLIPSRKQAEARFLYK